MEIGLIFVCLEERGDGRKVAVGRDETRRKENELLRYACLRSLLFGALLDDHHHCAEGEADCSFRARCRGPCCDERKGKNGGMGDHNNMSYVTFP